MDATLPDFKAAYLEDWLDTIESLPCELQRNFSLIRELDSQCQDLMGNIESESKRFLSALGSTEKSKSASLRKLTSTFQSALKHSEDKIDKYIRRLDSDLIKFEDELTMTGPIAHMPFQLGNNSGQRSIANNRSSNLTTSTFANNNNNSAGQSQLDNSKQIRDSPSRKRRNNGGRNSFSQSRRPDILQELAQQQQQLQQSLNETNAAVTSNSNNASLSRRATSNRSSGGSAAATSQDNSASVATSDLQQQEQHQPLQQPLKRRSDTTAINEEIVHADPNEPTYCVCHQVSYGAMIACDNPDCDIEWFHYECVGLDSPPKGKWYCDNCRSKNTASTSSSSSLLQ